MDASVLMGLASGVGYVGKKLLKESSLNDPSSITNYEKWVAVLAGSMALKDYQETQKILPKSIS